MALRGQERRRFIEIKSFLTKEMEKDPAFRAGVEEVYRQKLREHSEYAATINSQSASASALQEKQRFDLLYDNPIVQSYVNRLGQSLTPKGSSRLYAFKVTLNPIPEAREVARAMHDFLATWLIKRDRKRADDFLTRRPVACANLDQDRENETVAGAMAIKEFALLLDAGLKAKSKHRVLEEAVAAVEPWDPELVFVEHSYQPLFSLRGIQRDEAAEYMCDSSRLAGDP